MSRLELQGICKGWDYPILDELDLTIEDGEFFCILGPSGISKTTLLRIVAGLESPDAGRVILGGKDITDVPPYHRPVALTFESYALYPHRSVFDNIASPLRAQRLPRGEIEARVVEVARILRIEELLPRRPNEASGGQMQRISLARTLVKRPEVFLLDEPISHLDARIRHELRQQFHRLQALRAVATIYVTHDYTEALSLGDRVGIMGRAASCRPACRGTSSSDRTRSSSLSMWANRPSTSSTASSGAWTARCALRVRKLNSPSR